MAIETILFLIAVLVMSVVIHEVSHGYVAYRLGDPTASMAGRLTLNPLKHLDVWGSFIVPVFLIMMNAGFVVGWAKPVPYNPYNLRNQRWGEALVSGSGPAVNLLIAVVFGAAIRLNTAFAFAPAIFTELAALVVYINILLAVFNMLPIPPLDGSKVFTALLPFRWYSRVHELWNRIAGYGIFVFMALIFGLVMIFWPILFAVLRFVFVLLTGMPLPV